MISDRLRKETAAKHAAVEAHVPLMRSDLRRENYVLALQRFYRIVRAWEIWAAGFAPSSLLPFLQERHRSPRLADDLHFFGSQVPEDSTLMPLQLPHTQAALWGSMYVVEGSTLGGLYIARHVIDVLHLTDGKGAAFFSGRGEQTRTLWNDFEARLASLDETMADAVVQAALDMFDRFEEELRGERVAA